VHEAAAVGGFVSASVVTIHQHLQRQCSQQAVSSASQIPTSHTVVKCYIIQLQCKSLLNSCPQISKKNLILNIKAFSAAHNCDVNISVSLFVTI